MAFRQDPPPANAGPDRDEADEPALDARVIDSLQRLQRPGAPSLVGRLVALYRAEAPALLDAIDAAIAGGRAQDLRHAAHPLKSSSAMLGAAGLAAIAARLEACGHEGALEGTAALALQARQELDRVLRALDARIGPGGA